MPAEGVVGDFEQGGVEGVAGEEEGLLEGGSPAGLNEGEVMILRGAVDFVADDRMACVGQMDADLVHAAGFGPCPDEGERAIGTSRETAEDLKTGAGGRAGGVDALLEINAGGPVDALAEKRGVDGEFIGGGPAPDDGGVLLGDAAALHEDAEMAGGGPCLGNENEAAGLAVEAIDDGDLAAVGEFEGEEIAQQMPHGEGIGGLAGMDLEERGLVEDDPGGRFGEDVEAVGDGEGLHGGSYPQINADLRRFWRELGSQRVSGICIGNRMAEFLCMNGIEIA